MAALSADFVASQVAGFGVERLRQLCIPLGITEAQEKTVYQAFLLTVDQTIWDEQQRQLRGIPEGFPVSPLNPDGSPYTGD